MAQKAFKKLERRMELATEMRLARLITEECNQLHERAAEIGVTALLGRPVHRAPPNQRFLKNTLRSVEFVNQKRDEDDMWRLWSQRDETKKGAAAPVLHSASYVDPIARQSSNSGKKRKYKAIEACSEPDPCSPNNPQSEASNGQNSQASFESLDLFLNKRRVRGTGRIGPQPETYASSMQTGIPASKKTKDPGVRKRKRDKKQKKKRSKDSTSRADSV